MKKLILFAVVVLSLTAAASAQVAEAAGKAATVQFPGVTPKQLQQLRTAKQTTPIVLPTWLPAGFKLAKIDMKLDRRVPIYDRYLKITYERETSGGAMQRFYLEAGFDGLGGLPYDATKSLRTQVGTIDLMYQPNDEDGNKIKNYAITEWFNIGRTAFHYVETYEDEPEQPGRKMLSLTDTEKILRSLRRF
jgi:hypothetical protein